MHQDDKQLARLYILAAEQGYADAQYNLGLMYSRGFGVPQDNVYAHMWWSIAASTGDDFAKVKIKLVEEKMTTSDISQAWRLAGERIKKNYKG